MKSIKEKAKEAQIGCDDIQAPAIGRGFVLGANYVLDEIEKLINEKQVEGNLPLFDLTHLLDKLKKK